VTYLAGSVASLVTDRNTWHSRSDQAWGSSRVWNSGSSFETDLSNMTTDRNTWQSRANQAWGPSRTWNSGNSFETNYNNLLNGLNNPDGLTTTAMSWTISGHASAGWNFGTFSLSIPRTGHFALGFQVSGTHNNNGFGAYAYLVLGGTAGLTGTQTNGNWTNTGSSSILGGYYTHGDYTSGQTVTVALVGDYLNTGSASGTIYAHFIPNATYHN